MKKFTALICTAVLTIGLLAGCSGGTSKVPSTTDGKDVYILVPSADHGWTGAALESAKQKAEEISAEDVYHVTVQAATDAKSQQEQLDDLLSRAKTPAGIVVLPYDNTLESSLLRLTKSGIPFVMYDRIVANPVVQEAVVANVKGDHIGIGSNTAERFLKNGLQPGEKVYVMVGDTSSVPELRTGGFKDTLIAAGWTADDLKNLEFSPVTNWSRSLSKQLFTDWINGKTTEELEQIHYIFVHDDEIAMGVLEALAGTEIEQAKKEVFCRSIQAFGASSGLEELYQVLRGTHSNAAYPKIIKNFDLFSLTYYPSTVQLAMQDMIDFLDGKAVANDHTIPLEMVDASNVSEYTGF